MADWDELRRAVVYSPTRGRLATGDAELDAFEARHGFKLPASYRSFIKEFGRCELTPELGSGSWKIAATGVVAEDDGLDLDRLI